MIADWVVRLDAALALRSAGALVVGYSGGVDSTALLHALAMLPAARARGLRAVHVDHRLQPQSAAWAAHCRAFCATLAIDCDVHVVAVDRSCGRGLEAAARDARHAAFEHAVRGGETLLLAQHRDDQAETLLLRLLRASGTAALAAMRTERPCGAGRLWRPLLDTARADLLAYAAAQGLAWIDDPSNADPAHDRNYLRAHVLPALRARWPHADSAFAASAALLAADADLLAQHTRIELDHARGLDPATLRVDALRALAPAPRAHVLRRWIAEHGLPAPPAAIVQRLDGELLDAAGDATPQLRWAGVVLRRWRDLLWLGRDAPAAHAWRLRWDGRAALHLPGGGGVLRLLSPRAFDAPVDVAPRRGGEKIRLPGRAHRHALKHVLQELAVPPWERERLPLLWSADGELLAAGDLVIGATLDAWLREHACGLQWTA